MTDALKVGQRLVELCRAHQNLEALDELYAKDVVSVEAMGDEQMPRVLNGIEAVRGKNQWWMENHEMHESSVQGPFPNEDKFAVFMDFAVTPKVGPMAGKRMQMSEVCLYTVDNGKITREEFYYAMPEC